MSNPPDWSAIETTFKAGAMSTRELAAVQGITGQHPGPRQEGRLDPGRYAPYYAPRA